jgi:hypothetical protein
MPLFTLPELRAEAWQYDESIVADIYTPDDRFDVFLSYRGLDEAAARGLASALKREKLRVYMACDDDEFKAKPVTKRTAAGLKDIMDRSNCLLYAATENAAESRWMPWELGYFDGRKGRVAIIPVKFTRGTDDLFERREYLNLYPYVTKRFAGASGTETLYVNEDETTHVTLADWVHGTLLRPRLSDTTEDVIPAYCEQTVPHKSRSSVLSPKGSQTPTQALLGSLLSSEQGALVGDILKVGVGFVAGAVVGGLVSSTGKDVKASGSKDALNSIEYII